MFDGFDQDTNISWFRGDESACVACPLQGSCEKQFEYAFKDNPFFYGPVPQGSYLQQEMLRFRKQVELSFAQESNQLTSVMKHKKVPVRRTSRVQTWFILKDTFRLIQRMIRHIRTTMLSIDHISTIKRLQKMEIQQLSLSIVA